MLNAQTGNLSQREKTVSSEPLVIKHHRQVYRGLEGEWVGYIISDEHSRWLPRQPLHWFFQYHMIQTGLDVEPEEVLWGVGLFPPGGDPLWVIPVYATDDMEESLDDDVVEVVYESEGRHYMMFMDRVKDELPPPYEGFRYRDASRLLARADQIRQEWEAKSAFGRGVGDENERKNVEAKLKSSSVLILPDRTYSNIAGDADKHITSQLELEAELREILFCRQWIIDYNDSRKTFHRLCRQWLAHPPKQGLDDKTYNDLFRADLVKQTLSECTDQEVKQGRK
jgi:hypothetical protein